MKRRVLAMFLSVAMAFTMLPAATLRAEENVAAENVEEADGVPAPLAEGELALGEAPVAEGNLARSATASTKKENTPVTNVNDGRLATGDPATSWNSWGGNESDYPMPVTLTWDAAQTISSMRIMWWSDGGGVTWPSNAVVEYLDGAEWKKIADAETEHGGFNGADGVWNVVNFGKTITTTSLRVRIGRNVQGTTGVGISEWEVFASPIKQSIKAAKITGNDRLVVGETNTYDGSAIPAILANKTAYEWTISPADVAGIVGDANKNTVQVTGLKEGEATLTLKATHDNVVKEETMKLRVQSNEINSLDTYKTSTAAGVAPILPDSVVANGVEFDAPTPTLSYITRYDTAEQFNSRLIPVTWEAVPAANYAAGKVGTTFTVKGEAVYDNKTYEATAEISVKAAVAAPETNSSVTFENVQLTDEFWAPKQEINAINSLNKAILEIGKPTGGEPNYDNAIKKLNGETNYDPFSGYVFQDSDIYKSIEAISYTLSATQNDTNAEMVAQRKKLEDTLERWIDKIEKVQYADGYIDTFFTLRSQSSSGGGSPGTHRWLNFANHEMYNAGHFLEGAVAYTRYREGIGNPDYRLYVAGKRFADHIVAMFGPNGKRHEVPGHEEIELALVKFAKLAEEYEGQGAGQSYYDTVDVLVARRGEDKSNRESGYNGDVYSQDKTPFKNETSAVGHSVRAGYFYTGVTDLVTLLPEADEDRVAYQKSLDTIWDSITTKKTYITGAVGAATASSSSEGFGADYDLPPAQSYAEICAAIAVANWNQRMNLLYEDAKYVDMVEKNLYNSILVGTNLDGNRFYYSTQLRVNGGNARSEWFGCACCPPNLMRTIASASGYMYTVHGNDVFVNMYAGSNGKVNVGGTTVALKQETEYPWDGAVKMTVNPDVSKAFTMNIRIPGWVNEQENKTVTIKVNGEAVTATAEKGYVAINRTWNKNDVITIDIPMEIRITEADPNIKATKGMVALQRGPIVYCMEKAGNAQLNTDIENFDPLNFVIPRDAELTATYNKDLLNGVVELTGDVKYQSGSRIIAAKLQAIPYYAWNNRGDDATYTPGLAEPKNKSTKMLIWTNAEKETIEVPIPELRSYAKPSVNHVGWGMGAENFADDSEDTFWNGHNDADLQTKDQWMMYDFGTQKVKLNGSKILFYDNTVSGDAGVMKPDSVTVECKDASGLWKEVTISGEQKFELINDNQTYELKLAFADVETTAIRITLHNGSFNGNRTAVAVYDWKVEGDIAATSEDKEDLASSVEDADKLIKEDYTEESWNKFQQALAAAKEALAKENPGLLADIKTAEKALVEAMSALKKVEPSASSKSELNASIAAAEAIVKGNYTNESWDNMQKALAAAKEIAAKKDALQSEINGAKKDLDDAVKALSQIASASKTQLNASIKAADAIAKGNYTTASWNKMQAALAEAKKVAAKANATQSEIDKAKKALDDAVKALVKNVTVTKKKKTLVVGETFSVASKGCTYSTSDRKIATVTSKGKVTAKKNGKAVIKATNKSKNTEIQYTVTIKKAPKKIAKVTYKLAGKKKAVKIKLKKNKGTISLKKGKSLTLKPTLPNKTYSKFKYSFTKKSYKKYATLSAKGKVKAKKKGTVKVKIQTLNKKSVTITIKIK